MHDRILVTLTRVEIPYDEYTKRDCWFVEKFVGLDIFDISNGRDYEEQLKIAKQTAEENGVALRINR